MKRTVEKYFCDLSGCLAEAFTVCSACEKDICESHRAWMDTQWMRALPPGAAARAALPSSGFNICNDCITKFEQVFNKHRRKGDGFGPLPKPSGG